VKSLSRTLHCRNIASWNNMQLTMPRSPSKNGYRMSQLWCHGTVKLLPAFALESEAKKTNVTV